MAPRAAEISYPLRERRRIANRKAFMASARDLFAARGFSRTTMQEIAERAELHVQTLYRHFPTKHAMFTAIEIESFRDALEARDSDTLAFWRSYVQRSAKAVLDRDGGALFLQYVRNVKHDPKLTAARAEIRIECTELLAEGIRGDFAFAHPSPHLPILVANMLWGGNADAVRRWSERGGGGDLEVLAVAMADEVIAICLGELGLRPVAGDRDAN